MLWIDNTKVGKAYARADNIESWISEHNMACVSDGQPGQGPEVRDMPRKLLLSIPPF